MTNKLTDEQREQLGVIKQTYMKFCTERPFDEIYQISVSDFELLLSSEQAWKEEAERIGQIRRNAAEAHAEIQSRLVDQLNQAIEVLKEIANSNSGLASSLKQKAGDFLSSLPKEDI